MTKNQNIEIRVGTGAITVKGARLLRKNEFNSTLITKFKDPWWLADKNSKGDIRYFVNADGEVSACKATQFNALRPALDIENINGTGNFVGNRFTFLGMLWRIVNVETALCEKWIEVSTFEDAEETIKNWFNSQIAEKFQKKGQEPGEVRPWYFTFGSDKQYPYPDAYVVVMATSEADAVQRFRQKFPDRTNGCVNCAFWYSENEWKEKWYNALPAEVLGSGVNLALTWDDFYVLAEDQPCGSWWLKLKDKARGEVDDLASNLGLESPESAECPEDEIDMIVDKYEVMFDDEANIVSWTDPAKRLRTRFISMIIDNNVGSTPGCYNVLVENKETGKRCETQGDLVQNKSTCDMWNEFCDWLLGDMKEMGIGDLVDLDIVSVEYAGTENSCNEAAS